MTDRLWANPTLHRRDDGWSWIVWRVDGGQECWAPAGDELDDVIAIARSGAPRDELTARLPAEEAAAYIDSLLAAGVLTHPARLSPGGASENASAPPSDLLATFARDHGDVEVPLLAAADIPIGGWPLLAGLQITAPAQRPIEPPRVTDAIVADVVIPGGPPPSTPYAIALAPVEAATTWLPLDDLRVSIVEEQLVVRSVALGRAVIPRLRRSIHPGDPALLRLLAALGEGGAVQFPDREIAVSFPLGGEWLEVKLYTTPRLADRVLAELVLPFVAGTVEWHFIRYADPRWHVRLRLHGAPRTLVGDVLPALREAADGWLASGRLVDFQVGTYRREVGRYGGARGVLIAERMFTADSECVARLCGEISPDADGEEARWRIAALGIAALVRDLVPPADVPAVFTHMRDDFLYWVGAVGLTAHAAALVPRLAASADLDDARAIFHARSARLAPLVDELRALERAGGLSRPIATIAASLVHMFANRLLRGFALEQELVLYELLCRAGE